MCSATGGGAVAFLSGPSGEERVNCSSAGAPAQYTTGRFDCGAGVTDRSRARSAYHRSDRPGGEYAEVKCGERLVVLLGGYRAGSPLPR